MHPAPEPPPRGHAGRLATGSLAQQASQVSGLLSMLVLVTVLARRLAVAEFGVYGVLSSLAGYLLVIQNAGAGAAVRELAAMRTDEARARTFSNAVVLYLAVGAAAGVIVALIGLLLSGGLDLPASVARQARIGPLPLRALTAVGGPLTLARDALRARPPSVRLAIAAIPPGLAVA